jgi:hypothetical protein
MKTVHGPSPTTRHVGVAGRFVDVVAGLDDLPTVDELAGALEIECVDVAGVAVRRHHATDI